MTFFGLGFLVVEGPNPWIKIPLSLLYAAIGVWVFVKGIKARYNASSAHAPEKQQPMFSPKRPVSPRPKEEPSKSAPLKHFSSDTEVGSTVPPKRENCAICGKNITYLLSSAVYIMNGEKCCRECKEAMEQKEQKSHMVCSVCGDKLSIENVHVVDNALLCRYCFVKKYGNMGSCGEDLIS